MLAPPQSLHLLLTRICWQAPSQSLHLPLTRLSWQMQAPSSPCPCGSYDGRCQDRRSHRRIPCSCACSCCARTFPSPLGSPSASIHSSSIHSSPSQPPASPRLRLSAAAASLRPPSTLRHARHLPRALPFPHLPPAHRLPQAHAIQTALPPPILVRSTPCRAPHAASEAHYRPAVTQAWRKVHWAGVPRTGSTHTRQ
jgi:hypothetical protein